MSKTQMNVRIDADDKRNGDLVFADLGYSPTEVVNLVWRFAAQNRSNRRRVRDVLSRCEAGANPEETARRERAMAAMKRKRELDEEYKRFFADLGIQEIPLLPDLTNEEMRETAARERMEEKGWSW